MSVLKTILKTNDLYEEAVASIAEAEKMIAKSNK